VISIGTKIPRTKIFRFENYWLQHSAFTDIVKNAWNILVSYTNSAKRINAKLKKCEKGPKVMVKKSPLP
jgi:hypothetical protein